MCSGHIGINSRLKPAYEKPPMKKDLAKTREALSVVAAAVLIQVTIAARSVLPVGFGDDTGRGTASMEQKAVFSVFLFAETIAFFCSMSALFCIIWSMSCDPDKSTTLLHRSVPLLSVALLGTLVVFMTGVSIISAVSLSTTFGVFIMFVLVVFQLFPSEFFTVVNS